MMVALNVTDARPTKEEINALCTVCTSVFLVLNDRERISKDGADAG